MVKDSRAIQSRLSAQRKGPGVAYFRHVETSLAGPVTYVTGITDLEVQWLSGTARLYASTALGGAITSRSLAPGLGVIGTQLLPASGVLPARMQMAFLTVGSQPVLAMLGRVDAGLRTYALGGDGALGAVQTLATGTGEAAFSALESLTFADRTLLVTSAMGGTGLTSWQLGATGQLTRLAQIATTATARQGTDITATAQVSIGGTRFVLAASTFDNRLMSFQLGTDGALRLTGSLGVAEGLGIAAPSVLRVVTVDGVSYALLAAAGSSSISVARIAATGALTATDHVIDSLDTRFQAITVLEVVTVEGRVFVIAGGGDDGLSLLTLLPGGRLLHLESIADTGALTLANVSALAAAWTGSQIEAFVASGSEAGITRLALETGALAPAQTGTVGNDTLSGDARGDLLAGGAGADLLSGGAGIDILLDGDGVDTLWGGAGADTFVLSADGAADVIQDFQITEDRMDLSAWGLLYDLRQLSIQSTATGAILRFGTEVLTLVTATGTSLTAQSFTNAHIVNLSHSPILPDAPPEPVIGTAGNDTLTGGSGADTLMGGGGNDQLSGMAENDQLYGGTGDDSLSGGADNDTLDGGDGNDTLDGGAGRNSLLGGPGDDRLLAGNDGDTLDGGAGNDTVTGGAAGDLLSGGDGVDVVTDGAGSDLLFGGAGADTFVLLADGAADAIGDFEIGADRLDLTGLGPLYSMRQLVIQSTATGATLRQGSETLTLVSSTSTPLDPARVLDACIVTQKTTLAPPQGTVALAGTAAADQLTGTAGHDLIRGEGGNDTLTGGAGDDVLQGGFGADVLDGGDGIDTASYQGLLTPHLVDLLYPQFNSATSAGDSFVSIENLLGSESLDDLRGTQGDNVLDGGQGADVLHGRGGNDVLIGGAGNDVLVGGQGADLLIGGAGRDHAAYFFSFTALVLDLAFPDKNTGEAAGDIYEGIEDLTGGFGNDLISGDSRDNGIYGRDGADSLYGRQGNDGLNGGTGNDYLNGGAGHDTLSGGADADTFVFSGGRDVITDFSFAEADRISVSRAVLGGVALKGAGLAAMAHLVGGQVVFDFGNDNSLTVQSLSSLDGLANSLFSF